MVVSASEARRYTSLDPSDFYALREPPIGKRLVHEGLGGVADWPTTLY